jgi:glycosyltransferase involved in cell wall biosynthesis
MLVDDRSASERHRTPRIHIVATRVDRFGGAEVYTTGLAAALAARGYHVTVICHGPERPSERPYTVRVIPRVLVDLPVFWRLTHWIEWLSYRRPILGLEDPAPDVMIVSAHLLGMWYWRRYPQVPMVYLPHSLVAPIEVASYFRNDAILRRAAWSLWRHLERQALRRAQATVRFTEFARESLVRYYGRRTARSIVVLPPPVDPPRPAAKTGGHEESRFLLVGRLTATKNVSLAIRALAAIRDAEWQLDVVGEGDELAELRGTAEALEVGGRVRFHGAQADVGSFYRSADLLLFPSRLESAGLVVLEAMSHGVPALVIRPDHAGYRSAAAEFITHDVDGFVARDEEDFHRLLACLAAEPARLSAAGRAARAKVLEQHTWAAHVARWEQLFAELGSAVGSGGPPPYGRQRAETDRASGPSGARY